MYWSLSLEEQFYVLFPFVALLLPRRLFVPALLVVILPQLVIEKPGHLNYFIRTDGFAIGILLALWKAEHPDALEPRILSNWPVRLLAFVVLAYLLIKLSASAIPHTNGLVTVVCGIWVFCASFDKGYVLPVRFLRPVVLWIGTRSYAMYVLHFTAFSASHKICCRLDRYWVPVMSPWTRYTPAGLVTLVLLAEFTYRVIEIPLRNTGRKLAARPLFRAAPRAA